ncbi:hypothetical protein HY642_01670 [Candidatus Woesearchaeota archaeon]|nr:hypothetical protein [Candidatus Woesearchaeota archaeon]
MSKINAMVKAVVASVIATAASIPSALAHCPVCTAATGAAVAAGRIYGINDGIMGVFIGAFALSTGLWVSNVLKKRHIALPGQAVLMGLASLVLTIVSLHIGKLFTGSPSHWGLPGLLTGILFGSMVCAIGYGAHHVARHYAGRNILPMQGVAAVLLSMIISVLVLGATV